MKASKRFNPDPLLGAFASGLAGKGLTSFVVKWILETEGFYETGKSTIEEITPGLLSSLYEAARDAVEKLTSKPHMKFQHGHWQRLQELWNTPKIQRVVRGEQPPSRR
jgi:hypothetical protein